MLQTAGPTLSIALEIASSSIKPLHDYLGGAFGSL